MEKLNIKIVKCSCGKKIEEYDTKTKRGETIHHGYPETHCHCRCGSEWGNHSAYIPKESQKFNQ